MIDIKFNVPPYVDKAADYIQECVKNQKICGDGEYTKKCNAWIEERTGTGKCLLTTSCTHATELAALLCDIRPGDEVIMPSYTFVSTADAFVLRGAIPVFVDIRPDTMNIDETLIEDAITEKTRAIVPVHYAGVGCEMDTIMDIAKRHNLKVVEDAAQGIMATYKGKALGTIGDFGAYSFHETKNYSMGEGGALLIRDQKDVEEAEIIREKGTNRSKFFRGQITVREKEHIAMTHELFTAGHIQCDHRVCDCTNTETDFCRHICLNQSSNNLCNRVLCSDYKVDATGTGFLCNSYNMSLNGFSTHAHKVG